MSTIGIIFAVLASVTWGMVYTIDQKILTNVSPILWLTISSIITAMLMLPVIFLNMGEIKTIIHSGRNNLLLILLVQILAIVATFFIFSSIKHLGASTASVLEITYPVFVIIFCFFLFRENVNVYFWLGTTFILLGSFIVIKFS
jgi:drug/metabolite transporter (DMT)-like permease